MKEWYLVEEFHKDDCSMSIPSRTILLDILVELEASRRNKLFELI